MGAAAMQQVADWLAKLGLGQYAQRFAENDFSVLPDLTDQDLKDIGVSLGHRRQLPREIANLDKTAEVSSSVASQIAPDRRSGGLTACRGYRRAPPRHGDVLRPRRSDSALGRPRGSKSENGKCRLLRTRWSRKSRL
jgi:hypothetical protein